MSLTFEDNVEEVRRMWAVAIKGDNFYIKTGQGQTGELPPKLSFAFHAERDRFVQEALDAMLAERNATRDALKRCCEVIENDVRQLRQEGFEGASWQLDAIRKARRFVETTDPLPDIGVSLDDR